MYNLLFGHFFEQLFDLVVQRKAWHCIWNWAQRHNQQLDSWVFKRNNVEVLIFHFHYGVFWTQFTQDFDVVIAAVVRLHERRNPDYVWQNWTHIFIAGVFVLNVNFLWNCMLRGWFDVCVTYHFDWMEVGSCWEIVDLNKDVSFVVKWWYSLGFLQISDCRHQVVSQLSISLSGLSSSSCGLSILNTQQHCWLDHQRFLLGSYFLNRFVIGSVHLHNLVPDICVRVVNHSLPLEPHLFHDECFLHEGVSLDFVVLFEVVKICSNAVCKSVIPNEVCTFFDEIFVLIALSTS